MRRVQGFTAGFIATLIFHQGLLWLLNVLGVVSVPPYNLTPVPPLGIPAVLSLAFFGGLWGLALDLLIARRSGSAYWLLAGLIGAIAPTAVAMLIVFPLKGLDVSAKTWIGGFMLNAAWGLGTALILSLWRRRRTV